jgi:hypothetical protein
MQLNDSAAPSFFGSRFRHSGSCTNDQRSLSYGLDLLKPFLAPGFSLFRGPTQQQLLVLSARAESGQIRSLRRGRPIWVLCVFYVPFRK